MMNHTKISDKYQVVIPKRARERLGLRRGQQLHVYVVREGVLLAPTKDWPEGYLGSQRDLAGTIDWARALTEERAAWDHR